VLFLIELFSRCLSTGLVLSTFKATYITPRLKKSDLDLTDPKSCHLIANLTVLWNYSNVWSLANLWTIWTSHDCYLTSSQLIGWYTYRAKHYTETAVTNLLSVILALDCSDLTVLTRMYLRTYIVPTYVPTSYLCMYVHTYIRTYVLSVLWLLSVCLYSK